MLQKSGPWLRWEAGKETVRYRQNIVHDIIYCNGGCSPGELPANISIQSK